MVQSSFRLAALALGALALAGVAHANSGSSGLACGVSKTSQQGLLAIEGVVQSPVAIQGEYRFALKSLGNGGSSNVSQGGGFSAAANTPISVGQIMVGAGSNVDIDFTITSGGKQYDCSAPLTTRT
ncbi:curli-like amyloid fiber formation chaperone CsgH [Devosia sediminis]|uniref:CsgH-like domain-containing protein n=1 Tax=Devosia sediminis TaxID=2798801 RepID=A0A934MKT4_9HYPH|nr:curli-like amyloid fiber formation chaperone CsgH [Devosia sediminis]MBJ3783916.1 hypothetical protein [Devosia sediminis]